MIKEYIAYLKNNPEGYWFKRKLYGWGWTPARWQGWAVVFGYIGSIFLLVLTVSKSASDQEIVVTFLLPVVVLTALLFFMCFKKGEKPHWRWGSSKDDR